MKNNLSFCLLFFSITLVAQIPTGYYNTATGSGYTLKTQLKNIITNGHIDRGYNALYDAYILSDSDQYYENDNTVLDMYSENPVGNDAYNYNHNDRLCGNYNSENDCYNREHIFPQGFFNENLPMRSDIHHIVPTDGYVNNRRSNYPFGEVSSASYTSQNGSKVGNNTFDAYNGVVFEPINEFKGDIARMLLYFATRYEDESTSNTWESHSVANNPMNGNKNQFYETWYIKLLYKWHLQDPVNQREIDRNNEAYKFQGNRNPFIDHPEYVAQIWSNVLSSLTFKLLDDVAIYPNPSTNQKITVKIPHQLQVKKISIYSILGTKIRDINLPNFTNQKLEIQIYTKGIYMIKIRTENETTTKKVVIQ